MNHKRPTPRVYPSPRAGHECHNADLMRLITWSIPFQGKATMWFCPICGTTHIKERGVPLEPLGHSPEWIEAFGDGSQRTYNMSRSILP